MPDSPDRQPVSDSIESRRVGAASTPRELFNARIRKALERNHDVQDCLLELKQSVYVLDELDHVRGELHRAKERETSSRQAVSELQKQIGELKKLLATKEEEIMRVSHAPPPPASPPATGPFESQIALWTMENAQFLAFPNLENEVEKAQHDAKVYFGSKCVYCDEEFFKGSPRDVPQLDHYIPVRRGGQDFPWNLVWACRRCNIKKKDKMPSEFVTDGARRSRIEAYLTSVKGRLVSHYQASLDAALVVKQKLESMLRDTGLRAVEMDRIRELLEAFGPSPVLEEFVKRSEVVNPNDAEVESFMAEVRRVATEHLKVACGESATLETHRVFSKNEVVAELFRRATKRNWANNPVFKHLHGLLARKAKAISSLASRRTSIEGEAVRGFSLGGLPGAEKNDAFVTSI